MKKNRFTLLIVALLAFVSVWFYLKDRKGSISPEMKDFRVQNISTVNKIVLSEKTNSVSIEKKEQGIWQVNDTYPVSKDNLNALFYIFDHLDVKVPVSKKSQDSIVSDLLSDGILCEVYQENKLAKTYYVGKKANDLGTPMLMLDADSGEPSSKAFVMYIPGVDKNLSPRYAADVFFWREHIVFQYNEEEIRSVKMESPMFPEAGYELFLTKEGKYGIKMLNTNENVTNIDTASILQYLTYFSEITFESFKSDFSKSQFENILNTRALNSLTITDTSGIENTVRFYPAKRFVDGLDSIASIDPNKMYALLNNRTDLVEVKFYEVGKLMPPVSYFVRK